MDRKEKYKNARSFIVLLAAFIALLLNIKFKRQLVQSLIIVIIVIIVFYIISSIAIKLIDKIINMETYNIINPSEAEEANEDNNEDNNLNDDNNGLDA